MSKQTGELQPFRDDASNDRAVVFLHGFSGKRDDTWAQFPGLIGTNVPEWNVFTLGYATTLQPDVAGIWSADPDLEILAMLLYAQLAMPPLERHKSLAIVAHSMGGLIAQKALVDHKDLDPKVSHLVLFGTPSCGLVKAGLAGLWKRQLRNMAQGSEFIKGLRESWTGRFGEARPFHLTVVAGSKDQFVPPLSSLGPFDRSVCRVVPGDHVQIVKPSDTNAESYRLLTSILKSKATPPETSAPLRLAAELGGKVTALEAVVEQATEEEIVEKAIALDLGGGRAGAVALLEEAIAKNPEWTDAMGTLGGRLKRSWLESDCREEADRARDLYDKALEIARGLTPKPHDQIYYHAINAAFMSLVAFDDAPHAEQMAELALAHCVLAEPAYWNTATQAEAHLYMGKNDDALSLYRQALQEATEEWYVASSGLQASQIAMKLEDRGLQNALEEIFTPSAPKASKIFVSYSHKDGKWLDLFKTHMSPHLRTDDLELELWTDREIEPGEEWHQKIAEALRTSGAAVLLVSPNFAASDFIFEYELKPLLEAAIDRTLSLFWISLLPAATEEIGLDRFQAAHDTSQPIASLSDYKQNEIMREVARKVKAAALGATERFKAQ